MNSDAVPLMVDPARNQVETEALCLQQCRLTPYLSENMEGTCH